MAELVWVHNLNEIRVGVIANPRGLEVDERLQEAHVLTFYVRADDPKVDLLVEDQFVEYAGVRYRVTELDLERDGAAIYWHVTADALWVDLLGRIPGIGAKVTGATISVGLAFWLTFSGWSVGTVETDGGVYSLEVDDDAETILSIVRSWANLVDRELEFDTINKTVSLVHAQGSDRGLGFRYGRNLTAITRKAEAPLATRLYPVGKDGLVVTSVHPDHVAYIDNFDWYTDQGLTLLEARVRHLKIQRWTDEHYLTALNLYDAAVRRLEKLSAPRIAYELKVVDLSAITGVDEVFAIGDTVRVDDAPLGLTLSTRIVRKVTHPLEPATNELELAYLYTGLDTTGGDGGIGGGGGSTFDLFVALNLTAITLAGSLSVLDTIALGVTDTAPANAIFGFELDGTATGTGTLTIRFYYGTTQVGPTARVPFVAGDVHVSVPDYLVGLTTSDNFTARGQVTSGTGTIAVAVDQAHLYVLGTGFSGGGVGGTPEVDVVDNITYHPITITDAATTDTGAPTSSSPGDTLTITADATTDSVTVTLV